MQVEICTQLDEFLDEKTIWIATLADNTKVYQDDNRPGVSPSSAWIRLGNYLRRNVLGIAGMALKFRSHIEILPQNAAGYYLARGILGHPGSPNKHFLVAGFQAEDKVICRWFKTPELIVMREVVKSLAEVESPWFFQNPSI